MVFHYGRLTKLIYQVKPKDMRFAQIFEGKSGGGMFKAAETVITKNDESGARLPYLRNSR